MIDNLFYKPIMGEQSSLPNIDKLTSISTHFTILSERKNVRKYCSYTYRSIQGIEVYLNYHISQKQYLTEQLSFLE